MKLTDLKLVNQGEHLALYSADYMLPNNTEKRYEFVSRAGSRAQGPSSDNILTMQNFPDPDKKPDGVIIFTLSPDKKHVLLMREFRPAAGQFVFNHPMGLVDPGESWTDTAERELYEETGLRVHNFIKIMPPAFTAPGMSDQKTVLVIATACGPLKPSQNPVEQTDPFWATKQETMQLLHDPANQFTALTQASLFAWCCMPD